MNNLAIRCEGLSKKYRIGERESYGSLRDVVTKSISAPFRRLRPTRKRPDGFEGDRSGGVFWALKDLSFEVGRGDVVGIIGRNGAGKSTLLKILSRITAPTEGEVEISGRVGSLLEVGTGFHPELTGRENIYLNGAILGMKSVEIESKFDEIVAFAEIDKFLDTPVKRYSSGMYVRLAFAVAAHLEPEILIVDEVLAVGDAQFQKKCLGKMKHAGAGGRTVFFVSHNMAAISSLCSKVIWLDGGRLVASGEPRHIIGDYLCDGGQGNLCWKPEETRRGAFRFNSVTVASDDREATHDSIPADAAFKIIFDYSVNGTLPPGRLAFLLTNQDGIVVLSSASSDNTPTLNQSWAPGRNIAHCSIPSHLLSPNRYFLTVSEPTENHADIIHENVINFTISEMNSLVARDGRPGVVLPKLDWSLEVVDGAAD